MNIDDTIRFLKDRYHSKEVEKIEVSLPECILEYHDVENEDPRATNDLKAHNLANVIGYSRYYDEEGRDLIDKINKTYGITTCPSPYISSIDNLQIEIVVEDIANDPGNFCYLIPKDEGLTVLYGKKN